MNAMKEFYTGLILTSAALIASCISHYQKPSVASTSPVKALAVANDPSDEAQPNTVAVPIDNDVTPAAASYTDGPTPLTIEQFAELQKWLRDGKSLSEWVDNNPDPEINGEAIQQPANDPPPAPARVYAPAVPSGRYELRSNGAWLPRNRETVKVWVPYQQQPPQRTAPAVYYGGCSGPNCGGRR